MRIKTFMIAAMAAVVGLAACSKESGPKGPNDNDGKKVKVSVSNASDGILGRAEGVAVGTKDAVFNTGFLYFTTEGNVVTKKVIIANTSAAYHADSETVGIGNLDKSDGGSGSVITGVPGNSRKVFVVGNNSASIGVGDNISTLAAAKVEDQYDAVGDASATPDAIPAGGIRTVMLWGTGPLTQKSAPADDDEYEASITVTPISSRFEVVKITAGDNSYGTNHITEFKVEGIFMNNYYPTMSLDGKTLPTVSFNGSTPANYVKAGGTYANGLEYAIYDYAATGIGKAQTGGAIGWAPKTDGMNVWGYNVLAPTATTYEMPHIVIRISGVKVLGSTNDTYYNEAGKTWFLTIRNFYKLTAPTVAITALDRAKVYNIADLVFNETNLSEVPEQNEIKAYVDITVTGWTTDAMGFDFD